MRFQHEFFAFFAQASFYIDSIWFRLFAETRLCALSLQLSILTKCLSIVPASSQTLLSRYSSHAANGKLAASALHFADAVSFEFDDINVTAQRVMTQTATLMAACSPFTASSSKTIVVVKFRRTDAFL